MVTSAYRSVLAMRKLGYHSETTEHRNGKFRKDLFDAFDAIAFKANEPVIFIQAYLKGREKEHAQLNAEHPIIKDLLASGCKFEHQIHSFRTKKGRKYWSMERRNIR